MKKIFITLVLLLHTTICLAHPTKIVYGSTEEIMLIPPHIILNAKFDTGADSSSLHARNIKIIFINGKKFASFDTVDQQGIKQHLQYLFVKNSKIKSRTSEQQGDQTASTLRPEVKLKICIGNETRLIKTNLVDRHQFKFKFLLGREGMNQFNMLIDPKKEFLIKLNCDK